VCAADAEEVEHGGLGLEDGAAAYGSDFDGGHGDGDLEVAVYTVCVSLSHQETMEVRGTYLFMMVMQFADSTT
jgi:hypothetical protein